MHELGLETAVGEIHQACDGKTGKQSPFFLIVGAGISAPPLPLAPEIEKECRAIALKYNRIQEPDGKAPIDTYSHWFKEAFAHAEQRQQYLRKKMLEKPISPATFRLAHLLLNGSIGNTVVTPNFDDFLSRALQLFGGHPIVCDHPHTIGRISRDSDDIQIVHVHGTYWYYDCCNLRDEIERREAVRTSPHSIPGFLDSLLWNRSAIVVGYSGWEGDVIMSALKRRLPIGMGFDVYWFCYKRSDYDLLPEWVKSSANIRFVLPKPEAEKLLDDSTSAAGNSAAEELVDKRTLQTLPAQKVFDHLVRSFDLAPPLFTEKPLQFFADQLRKSIFLDTTGDSEQDIFGLQDVVARVQKAAEWADEDAKKASAVEIQLETIRDAIRRSAYTEAIHSASNLIRLTTSGKQKEDVIQLVYAASSGLADDSSDELTGYQLVCEIAQDLEAKAVLGRASMLAWARALFNKGVLLGRLQRNVDALAAYDEVVRRFGDATETGLRELVAKALLNKGFLLSSLQRSEDELAVYDEVVRRFGDSDDSGDTGLREQVARALFNKGVRLGTLQRNEDALAAYDEVVRCFGGSTETDLRETVGKALINKGFLLGTLHRNEGELTAYDEVVRRFGDSSETVLRELVATALFNKGVLLDTLQHYEDALAAYDEVVRRFGGSTETDLREHVATALFNRGVLLDTLQRHDDALAAYGEVVRRFASTDTLTTQQIAAEALLQRAVVLKNLGKNDQVTSTMAEFNRLFAREIDPEIEKFRKQLEDLCG